MHTIMSQTNDYATRLSKNNNFWNFWLDQISDVILSHYILEGRGIGGGVREYNAIRFLFRMDNFLMAPLVFIT